jgi:prepilin-type processing-associated H-X9-DG protein
VEKLMIQAPRDYVDPHVETPGGFDVKRPNPLLSFMTDPDTHSRALSGKVAVLLAEPGQGKTYMSRHLVSKLPESRRGIVPLMVDSSQWQTLSIDDQRSLPKTIAHSFRHFDANIGWLDGHEEEFLKATLKADLFELCSMDSMNSSYAIVAQCSR